MATPTETIKFDFWDTVPECFMVRFADISRQGFNGHLFKFIGTRGQPSQMVCHAFFDTKPLAIAAIAEWKDKTGKEIFIEELDNDGSTVLRKAQVFITNLTGDWDEVLSSNLKNFQAIAKMTVIQTGIV